MDKMNACVVVLLKEKGTDIYRMKGDLSIEGEAKRFVFKRNRFEMFRTDHS